MSDDFEYLQDCLAREMLRNRQLAQLWAAKRKEPEKEKMRERMKRVKRERR